MRRKSYHIQDHSAEANLFARRAIIALVITAGLALLLISNMFYLQISSYNSYQTRSNENRIKVQPIAPNRGVIRDINGRILAGNEPTFSLEIVPEQVGDMDETLSRLKEVIVLPDEHIEQFKKTIRFQRRFKSLPIKQNLTEQEVATFSVHQHQFPGVSIEARLARHYPYAEHFTHAVGYVGKINKRDLTNLEDTEQIKNYAATRSIGKLGIEKYYETILHGQTGSERVEVNHRSRVLRQLSVESPIPGADLHLAIDADMQVKAKQVLKNNRGAIIAMDPRDGALLTFYSNPSYDPNLFVNGISNTEYAKIIESKDKPMLNRLTQGLYPPASTVKPQLALLGLDKGLVTPKTTIWDPGYWKIPNVEVQRRFRDWKPDGHGHVDLLTSIKQSCDIYFYDLAFRLGINNISEFGQKFGFGQYSGIDINEEYKGIMPSRAWKKQRFKQPWYQGDTISIGIGQGYWTTTPIQLLIATSVLVNDGKVVQPRLVTGITENGEHSPTPTKYKEPIILNNAKNWGIIKDTLYQTVQSSHGTAHAAFAGAVYSSAGKTGTAQLFSLDEDEEYKEEDVAERYRDNAMYVGFAPYESPTIVIVVAVENAGGGGANAAPIAREMLDLYFALGLSGKRNNAITTATSLESDNGIN